MNLLVQVQPCPRAVLLLLPLLAARSRPRPRHRSGCQPMPALLRGGPRLPAELAPPTGPQPRAARASREGRGALLAAAAAAESAQERAPQVRLLPEW